MLTRPLPHEVCKKVLSVPLAGSGENIRLTSFPMQYARECLVFIYPILSHLSPRPFLSNNIKNLPQPMTEGV